ncbi:hypothetical protein [Acinetobacter baumannii]|uniref:hypothetical protein n=1 Tax=Acinetobacter baumannii TaxID=470 RepID=UPI001C2D6B00|nr:hypothetical protein [Acinetobacter baumannii]QXF10143.1 hypothetical protein IAG34_13340 [Acinetobacter baumannii]
MDKPMTFNEWMGKQGNLALVHANCCRIAYEAGQQSQQAKVEEQAQEIANLKSLIQGHELRHQQNLSIKQKLTRKSEELQKRVNALTLALDQIAYPIPHMQKEAELNGCELNGYWAVKMSEDHTYSKDIARRALEKEQALKGDQYDEHRKKAEEDISKGASLTNHRIEL